MKYNYVFFWSPEIYYKYAFADILNLENVKFISGILENQGRLIKGIHKIHQSAKINRLLNLPFKNIWLKQYFHDEFKKQKPLIFIFHGSYYWMRSLDYFSYLKKVYPKSRNILLLMDTIESYKKYFKGKYYGDFDIKYIKQKFDKILTYNLFDAQENDLYYYPSIYSKNKVSTSNEITTDVFFIGKAKDRLETIHNVYESLCNKGFSCNFYIVGVPKNLQKYKGNIKYNQFLSYDEILKHIMNAKGILEVVQGQAKGFTFRLNEALIYDKNLITNNPIIDYIKYKESEKIFTFTDNICITKKKFDKVSKNTYNYQNEYSPKKLLDFIENKIGI